MNSTRRPQTTRRRQCIELAILLLLSISWINLPASIQGGGRQRPAAELAVCAACHRPDDQGRLSRIAFQRKTPEGWQMTVRRMVRMHGAPISVEQAKAVVKYLSDHQGLAPAEVRPIAYLLERRDSRERVPDVAVRLACVRCHSFARIAAQRRSREEWRKLKTFHLAVFPTLVYQMRQIDWPAVADRAIDYLARTYPLETDAWRRWRGNFKIEGRWMIVGHQPGRGDYFGDVVITGVGADRFRTQERLRFTDGQVITRTGKGLLYTGFAWRGSSRSSDGQPVKEVLHLSEDGKMFRGRWFLAASDQIGAEMSLYRKPGAPLLLGLSRRSLRAPTARQKLKIYGANFPGSLTTKDVDFGPGVLVHQLAITSNDELAVTLEVRADAPTGSHPVRVGNAVGNVALTVYKQIGGIKVQPEVGLARVGGIKVPKQRQQFEAFAFDPGADGIAGTADDLALGPIKVNWSIEEDSTNPDDDDAKFVGVIDQHGLFTPAADGPNPARRKRNDNVGQVWVVASYTPQGSPRPLTARAKLIVTVPRFIHSEVR